MAKAVDVATSDRDVEVATRLRMVIGRGARKLRAKGSGGLTQSQTSALIMVEASGPLRIGDLAAKEGVSAPTMTRIVAALHTFGHLTREPDPDDARSSFVSVSKQGRALLDRLRRDRTAYLAIRVAALDDADRARLLDALPVLEALLRGGDER